MKFKTLILTVFLLFSSNSVFAFWVWTPETNKWVNPKFAVKDTPQEQLTYALQIYKDKDYEKSLLEFRKLIRNYPKAKEAADAQFYIGRILEDEGSLYKAFRAYQVVIEKYPFCERSAQIVQRQYEIGEKMLAGKEKKNKFVSAVVGGEYDLVDVFRSVIKNAPYGKYAAPAQYKIGLYLKEKGLYAEAREEFDKVVNDYSDSDWVQAAKYQIALVDARRSSSAPYDQNITKSAVEEFKHFLELYPDAELSKEAKAQIRQLRSKEAENSFLIARFYEKQKKYKAARIYYNTIVNEYGKTKWASRALKKIQELNVQNTNNGRK